MRGVVKYALLATAGLLASATPAMAQIEAGDWLFRVRAIDVIPNESSGAVTGVPGSSVGVGDSVMPEIDFTYMATKNIGAELILGTTRHAVTGRGTISALGEVGHTWVLPPTLTLQYHFNPEGHMRPYLGAGVNYSIFYGGKSSSSLENALGGSTKFKLEDSFGYAIQGGIDIDVTKKIFVNADIKYIDMTSKARLTTGSTLRTVNVDINPIVVGLGIGFKL